MASKLSISPVNVSGLLTLLAWAADEGWNPGPHDAAAFHAADPGGFLIGSLAGEPVAAVSVVRYDERFAFLGLYIVRPPWRGRGFGLATWRAGLEIAGSRTVGLDGVLARQADYARSGFAAVRRTVRYQGLGGGTPPSNLVAATELEPGRIADYDATIFPARRDRFLEAWLTLPDRRTLAEVRDGQIVGYGVARQAGAGVKIGPLFADDEDVAERLFLGLAAWAGSQPLSLLVPQPNAAAVRLAERHGLTAAHETARMYRGSPPAEAVQRVFGSTTFELG